MGCLDKDIASCAMLAIGILPVGKGIKAVKALGKIVDGAISFYKEQKAARRILSQVGPACMVNAKANSFTAGTLVLLADGTSKPIEDIELGDEVLATNEITGASDPQPVVALISSEGLKSLVTITLAGNSGVDGSIVATNGHPFWVPALREWVDAKDLLVGQWLQTSAGTRAQIKQVEHRSEYALAYNLTVANVHAYHVSVEDSSPLVHNCNTGGFSLKGDRQTSGPFPRTAGAGETLFRQKQVGTVTAYARYDVDGEIAQRADLDADSAPHAGIPAPHILDMAKHVNPKNGQVFRSWEKLPRPLRSDEVLCGCR